MTGPPSPDSGGDPLARGFEALKRGRYAEARACFTDALAQDPSAEALDGLGQATWWLRDVEPGIELRARAYAAYRRAHRDAEAARVAVWIAREKSVLYGDDAVTDGWIARAAQAAKQSPDPKARGWVLLAQGEHSTEHAAAVKTIVEAVGIARGADDPDLEVTALARLGLELIISGNVEAGIGCLDEAMAAATAGEPRDQRSLGEAYCALTDAAELLGGDDRLGRWSAELLRSDRLAELGPLEGYGSASPHATLSAFCGSCCGGVFLASGRLDEAEEALQEALAQLRRTGLRSRCVHPGAQLADLRIAQGRVAEAAELLSEIEDLPEAVRPLAAIDLLHGDAAAAAARLHRAIGVLQGSDLLALPLHAMLVEVELDRGSLESAADAADAVARAAGISGSDRHLGEALLCAAGVAVASDSLDTAALQLREAATLFSRAGMALRATQSRLLLARAVRESDPPLAITEARAARASFERLGARRDADAATSLLRQLGVRAGPGPRGPGDLSSREREVLQLIAEGLSNPEISDRLFISRRTAAHHVSSILAKLGMRSRTEAAAFAAVHPVPHPPAATD